MKKIIVIVGCNSGALAHSPSVAIFSVAESDIERIAQVMELADSHSLSEARFQKPGAKYFGGDFSVCTPEVVVSGKDLWVSALFHEFEAEQPINTPAFHFDELVTAFRQSNDGDIWFPGPGDDDLLESVCQNYEDWDLAKNPIGYQVANTETGEHWNDRASFEVIPYAVAQNEFEEARQSGPDWELWTIYPETVEEPTLSSA